MIWYNRWLSWDINHNLRNFLKKCKGAFTNYVCIFWHFLTSYVPSLHFLCSKLHVFMTTYEPLSANVICESSLRWAPTIFQLRSQNNSCSCLNWSLILKQKITIFFPLSRPIGITLVSNLAMFVYASRILQKLQQKKKYLTQTSQTSNASLISREPMSRQFSRQISNVQKAVSTKVKSQKENIEK